MPDESKPLHTELRELIEAELVCPFCKEANRPGVTVIELTSLICFCRNCAKDGPLSAFQPSGH